MRALSGFQNGTRIIQYFVLISNMECNGKGECFEQTMDGYKKRYCDNACILQKCSTCVKELPEWVLDCGSGKCPLCKMGIVFDCEECKKRLVPIGHARKNGTDRPDWGSRKYHKKCYKLMNR